MGNGKRKGEAYQPSIPQNIMREEMQRETDLHKPRTLADRNRDREPLDLGSVFDEVVGPQEGMHLHTNESVLTAYGRFDSKVPELVHETIIQHDLVLSLQQWQVVQNMMEQAMRLGYAHGEQARDS